MAAGTPVIVPGPSRCFFDAVRDSENVVLPCLKSCGLYKLVDKVLIDEIVLEENICHCKQHCGVGSWSDWYHWCV